MRESNNKYGKIVSDRSKNDYVFYVIHDPDTGEYLTGPDHWEDLSSIEDDDFTSAFDLSCRFDSLPAAMSELQETVGPDLCERFPEEVIRLGVDRVVESITRELTLELEAASEVQTWGEDLEAPDRTDEPRDVDLGEEEEEEPEFAAEEVYTPPARHRPARTEFMQGFYAALSSKAAKRSGKSKKSARGKSKK